MMAKMESAKEEPTEAHPLIDEGDLGELRTFEDDDELKLNPASSASIGQPQRKHPLHLESTGRNVTDMQNPPLVITRAIGFVESVAIRERPSSIDLGSSHSQRENHPINQHHPRSPSGDNQQFQPLPPPVSLLNYSMMRKEAKKLSLARGIDLPAIQLNDVPTVSIISNSDGSHKKQHRRGKSLSDFPSIGTKQSCNTECGLEPTMNGTFDKGLEMLPGSGDGGDHSTGTASDSSPASIISPIGHTLKHIDDFTHKHDFNRTMHSDSFYVSPKTKKHAIITDETEPAIDIRIFYANGTAVQFSIENGMEAAADDLLQLMAEHLQIDDFSVAEEALAIWLVSPLLEIQLKPYHIPYDIYQKWPAFLRRFTTADEDDIALDEPLLVLRRNVLLTLDREVQFVDKYEKLAEVLYLHARDEYLSGRYPVEIENALRLVGLQLAIEFGPYNGRAADALDLIYDRLPEIAPIPHIKAIRSFHLFGFRVMECKKGLEDLVIEEYQTASMQYSNAYERHKEFLTILRHTPFYGAAFYSGTIDKSQFVRNKKETQSNTSTSSGSSDENANDMEKGQWHKRKRQGVPGSQTKLKSGRMSAVNFFERLRHLLPHRNGHSNGHGRGREILIGINHEYITMIDPKEHKLLEFWSDNHNSSQVKMSLDEKISKLFSEG